MRTASLLENSSGPVPRLLAGGWISRVGWQAAFAQVAAAILLLPIVRASGPAQEPQSAVSSYTVLYSFPGGLTDGAIPYAPLIRDTAGNFYSTTGGGGAFGYDGVQAAPVTAGC